MSYHDPRDDRATTAMLILFGLLAVICMRPARADIVTEFGAGYKLGSTSIVMRDYCHEVIIVETRPARSDVHRGHSCGGDNPAFIGWPIAWERDFGVWTLRAGWFHLSHWGDGGRDRELHLDAATVSAKVNWSEVRRRRK